MRRSWPLVALLLLLAQGTARAEAELSLRLSSWGSLSAAGGNPSDGVLGQVFVAPSLDVGEVIFLSISGGAMTKMSSLKEQVWNNAIEPRVAGGLRVPVPLGAFVSRAWASVFVGVRYEWFKYFSDGHPPSRLVAAAELMLGLDWRCVGNGRGCGGKGAPLFLRTDYSTPYDAAQRSSAFNFFVEQSLELGTTAGGMVAPVAALQYKWSDLEHEHWNNVLELNAGLRWRARSTPLPRLYGSFNVEVRAQSLLYTTMEMPTEHRVLFLLGFGLFGELAASRL